MSDRHPNEAQNVEPWAIAAGLAEAEWTDFLSVRDALRGAPVHCPWCEGSRTMTWSSGSGTCPACSGSGSTSLWLTQNFTGGANPGYTLPAISDELRVLSGRWGETLVPCPECGGSGGPCRECRRSGHVTAHVAAARELVSCLRCGGKGYSGVLMLELPCDFCVTSGRITIRDLDRMTDEAFEDRYCGFLSIEQMVSWGGAYLYTDCRDELDARWEARPGVTWRGVDLSGDDLSGLDLSGSNLSRCQLGNIAGTRFVGADLQDITFPGPVADACGCDFTDAVFDDADLSSTDLTGSTIELAASLARCHLGEGIGLTSSQVQACVELGAILDRPIEEIITDWDSSRPG